MFMGELNVLSGRHGLVRIRAAEASGLENAPCELVRLLRGNNFGKKIIKVCSVTD